jgi:toxin-antitoxin system PIN domain toxin
MLRWFADSPDRPWATCPITEAGFVRVSSNPKAIGSALPVAEARAALAGLRAGGGHRFLANDVSMTDRLVPPVAGHRQVTDALLLGVSRRHGVPLVTFDAALARLGAPGEVELLRA